MGLAASQARFLCITARKSECEYKSTTLAQEKLEITNQMSEISADYANAMNATKLVWQNDAATYDYGLTYGLLMTPSAANNFNPYMVTTKSGAIVLNDEFAAAAKAAGISKAGGVPSQGQRDKFIAALVPGGLITQQTANAITLTDYVAKMGDDGIYTFEPAPVEDPNQVSWNPDAGMGGSIMDKESVDVMDLAALIMSETIGQKPLDWGLLFKQDGQITELEYNQELQKLNRDVMEAQRAFEAMEQPDPSDTEKMNEYNKLKQRLEDYQKARDQYIAQNQAKIFKFDDTHAFSSYFQTEKNEISKDNKFTMVQNGVINKQAGEIENLTIGDILSKNIVIMGYIKNSSLKDFSEKITTLMEYIGKIFGYGQPTGTGLNVDEASAEALDYAMQMIKRKFLKPANAIGIGSNESTTAMTENSAYKNAANNNCLGTDQNNTFAAVSLTNMLASFLTYYDNALNGNNSNFVVGKSVDTSDYVTEALDYVYIGQTREEELSMDKKVADFYDQLYNNICEHGWRQDDNVQDSEYLESVLKDGRYSLASLNSDGYYYQTRYNETGYIVELTDEDAIAVAEAEFTRKKAELTYKEDSIDMKSKKLDSEISMLTTEYEAVKTLITKSIEKTFTMFSS